MPLKYRSDIDGLRAVAVLAVIFFHTNVPGFSGGFVGVDIFFVISGFLITSIILSDIKQGQFSLARFYERRIRRIFPALFPVIAFTLVVGAYLLDASAFDQFGKSITATTLFYSNILFCRESGYFAAPALQKPLLHTWSLAVEEQFYIFFPLVMVLIHNYLKSRYLLWILIALVFSLGASIYGVYHYPGVTFYYVPTRAWELLAGSILALGVLPVPSLGWLKNILSFTGLGLIIYSVGFYSESTLFPGYNALVPVLGAWLILYSNRGGGMPIVNKILSVRPLVFIGLISYSLYLWHWPFVAFAKYLMFRPLLGYEQAGIIFASLAVSVLSWKYIESPFRGRQMLLPERKRLFAVAGVVMVVASGIGGVIHLQNGMGWRYPETDATLQKVTHNPKIEKLDEWEKITEKIAEGSIPPIVGAKNVEPSFVLVGDSHARLMIPAMEYEANIFKLSGFIIPRSGVPFLLGINSRGIADEVAHNNAVLAFIKNHPGIKTVILVSRWAVYVHGQLTEKNQEFLNIKLHDAFGQYNSDQSNAFLLDVGLMRTVKALLAMHRNVVLVSDVPEIGYDVSRFYAIQSRFPLMVSGLDIRPTIAEYNSRQHEAQAIMNELALLPGVTLIHPECRMFDENGKGRFMANDELLYNDGDHLSVAGALYVAPVFDDLFKGMASEAQNIVKAKF